MIITYYGHSMFQIKLSKGIKILIDPYDDSVGYKPPKLFPDYICISHDHHDHNNVGSYNISSTGKMPTIIKDYSIQSKEDNIKISLFPSYHDDKKGSLRGKNNLILINAEGLNILHLGDLGHTLSKTELMNLKDIDILLAPIGGFYTIDSFQAKEIYNNINPKIFIPMHYKTKYSKSLPIQELNVFLDLVDKRNIEPKSELLVNEENIINLPNIMVLDVIQ